MTLSNGDQRGPPAPPEGVDAICDVFEAAWLAGQEPRIEDFLPGGEPVHQDVLLRELLLAEWDLRRRHEQHVELQTYLQRFAESGQFVAELWHVWQAKQSEGSLDGRANGLATAPHSPPAEELGKVIGRYKLLEKLGEGGFGTVWVAEQREPVKRRVALKVIKLGMDTRQVIARFEAERQALALMDHPNIAKVLDAGSTETGGPYFVMELVRGIPITQYCDQEQLSTKDRLDLFMKVCHAIQHAHQKGIIHRDIKPSNILVTLHDGVPVPKVIDFGIAKAIQQELTEKTIYTQLAQFIGTPAYMSPEQAEMSGLDIDTRSDIYSLGVLLYELLTGMTPFDAKELMRSGLDEMRKIIREREPLRPSSRLTKELETVKSNDSNHSALPSSVSVPHSAIDHDLDWIVMKCLEKDRARRYETANGLATDVERYLADEPVLACPPRIGYRLRKLVRRNKGPVLAVALVALALVGGIIGTTWGMIRAEQASRDAQRRLAQIEKATEILASVFRDVDPITAENQGLLSHELIGRRLAETAEQLEGEAVGDPLLVARLQHLLGISLRELGHPDPRLDSFAEQAEGVLVKAGRTRERLLGADHLDTVATKHELAVLYSAQKKNAQAEPLFNEVLAIRTARLGADHVDTLATKHHLAHLYRFQQKYALAETLCKEVLAIRTARLGAENLDTLATRHQLAQLYRLQGKNGLAEPMFQEILAIRNVKLGADHRDNLGTRHQLALVYLAEGKPDLAEMLLREVVAVCAAKLRADDSLAFSSQHDLALLYLGQGKAALAEPLLKELLAVRTARLGADHPETLDSLHELALLYLGQGKTALAEPMFKELLAVRTARLGADHPETLRTMHDLAALFAGDGNTVLAEPLFKELLAVRTAKLGADHPDTIFSRDGLATVYWSMKKFDQSIPLKDETLKLRTAKLGPDHPETLMRQVDLGVNYCDAGRFADGIALIKEVRQKGSQDPPPAWVRRSLLTAYVQAGNTTDATALVMEQVRDARQEFAADSPELAAALADNGKALLEAKAYADAEPLLLEGYQGLRQTEAETEPQVKDARLRDALERLVQLYDAWGKPDEAAKWRNKLESAGGADRPE